MYHKLYRVTDFRVVGDFAIQVKFDDGTQQDINFEPVVHGEMWGPLRDVALFNAVKLDPVAHTLTWPNGADFDPETLHNWPECRDELTVRAQLWKQVMA